MSFLRSLRWFVPALAFGALLAPVVRAADVENPEYKSWASVKPGTAVHKHQVVNAAGNKSEMEMTTKLISVTPEKAVVEDAIEMNAGGQKMALPATKRDVPAKFAGAAAPPTATPAPRAEAKESEETVEVGGKSYKCKVTEATTTLPGGGSATSKVWRSDEVPGGLVKLTSAATGAMKTETTITLISIDAAK